MYIIKYICAGARVRGWEKPIMRFQKKNKIKKKKKKKINPIDPGTPLAPAHTRKPFKCPFLHFLHQNHYY